MTRRNASPYPKGRRACGWCGTVKDFRSGRRFCGSRCAALARTVVMDDATLRAIATTASHAAARKREADVLAKVAGMTPLEAYRYGRALGQAAGYNSATYRMRRDQRRAA